jgi:hypothetical protein
MPTQIGELPRPCAEPPSALCLDPGSTVQHGADVVDRRVMPDVTIAAVLGGAVRVGSWH